MRQRAARQARRLVASAQERRGFTVTEVLVVVAILVVLMAILVPTMIHVRERAKRTICLSNCRQMGMVYNNYATAFGGFAPLGYSSTTKQFNYVVNVNDGDGKSPDGTYPVSNIRIYYTVMGPLYMADLITVSLSKAFFCPANTYSAHTWNNIDKLDASNNNPWPPVRQVVVVNGKAIKNTTRFGYGCRPAKSYSFGENGASLGGQVRDIQWPKDATTGKPDLPRLFDFQHRAIMADIVSEPIRVDQVHKTGANVLFGDFSAKWVERKHFNGTLSTIPNSEFFDTSNNNKILNDASTDASTWSGVWVDLDRQY